MTKPKQFTLAIEHPHEQRLDNFVVGENGELLQTLSHLADGFNGYWIFGPQGSGCSHLLVGCYLQAQAEFERVVFIPAAKYSEDQAGVQEALSEASHRGRVVIIDNVGCLLGDAVAEAMLMLIYQRLLHDKGTLLVGHRQAATALTFATPDLASRMRSLQHYQIQPLTDDDKMSLLTQRTKARGYDLSQSVLNYWLARGPRDVAALLQDLDRLDAASLEQQQRVTIPLLKQVLGY